MKTPICDFILKYAQNDNLRLHMPGHKGIGTHGETHDITEISGADSLYEANGIIAESEKNASELFGANTYYSAEGSSLAIRAMMYLVSIYAREKGEKPLVLAGRNVHKTFISAAALIDFDLEWMIANEGTYLSCKINADDVEKRLDAMSRKPTAVYITSPDYLGNISHIREIAKVCHEREILLIVDNAHGAYLNFLPQNLHPIALGADMCCDSAHKTLPALTGAAYMHISLNAPHMLSERAKSAMALFGSTSPSYLILESLDRVNEYIDNGYREHLSSFSNAVSTLKSELTEFGYTFVGDEPIKLTVSTKKYGYTGYEMASYLERNGIIPEFSDPDHLVLMLAPANGNKALERIKNALIKLPRKAEITSLPPSLSLPDRLMSIRDALLSSEETVSTDSAFGRTLASITVGCPPAVPIVVSGERIDENSIATFKYYGIDKCSVIKQ